MKDKKMHKTSVGGQALIEGVMMQGPRGIATAVRKTDGDIVVKHHEFNHLRDKHKFWGYCMLVRHIQISGGKIYETKDFLDGENCETCFLALQKM